MKPRTLPLSGLSILPLSPGPSPGLLGPPDPRFQAPVRELAEEGNKDEMAMGMEETADLYMASEAWLLQSRCVDEPMRGESADLNRAWSALNRAVEAREKVDLKDAAYEAAVKRRAVLAAKGFDKGGR